MLDRERRGKPEVITLEEGNETREFLTAVGGMRIVDKDMAETMLKRLRWKSRSQ